MEDEKRRLLATISEMSSEAMIELEKRSALSQQYGEYSEGKILELQSLVE